MTSLPPATELVSLFERLEAKIDRLGGEFQDLKAEVEQSGLKLPVETWISTADLGERVGVTDRTIVKWIKEGRFPESVVRKKTRGASFYYRLRSAAAIKIADRCISGDWANDH